MEIDHQQLIEGLGFFFEVICFILSGFFIWISLIGTIIFFICGMVLALFVGKKIKNNVIRNLK